MKSGGTFPNGGAIAYSVTDPPKKFETSKRPIGLRAMLSGPLSVVDTPAILASGAASPFAVDANSNRAFFA